MAFVIVPDERWEKVTCAECNKYLSVMPVKVYPNGEIKCGRCSRDGDGGAKSMLGTLFKHALFPCVNKFDGCSYVMGAENVEEHEMSCLVNHKDFYQCPSCDFKHSLSYFLYRHALSDHKEAVLMMNEIPLELLLEPNKILFYCENYVLFTISRIAFLIEDNELELHVTHFRHNCSKIVYRLVVSSNDDNVCYDLLNTGETYKLLIAFAESNELESTKNVILKFNFDIPQHIAKHYVSPSRSNLTKTDKLLGAKDVYGIMFQYTIKNLHELLIHEELILYSPLHFINEVPIQLRVEIHPKYKKSFGLYIYVDRDKTFMTPWSCDMSFQFTLCSVKESVSDYSLKTAHLFSDRNAGTGYGYPNFMCLYDILNPFKGFNNNDSITIKVEAKINSFKIQP